MKWVYWLTRSCADGVRSVREAPCVRVPHHDIDIVHALVENIVLAALQLEPERAVYVPGVQPLELFPGGAVVQVKLAEYARIAADLERLVDNVVVARPKHLRPLGTAPCGALQRHPHVRRLDLRGHAAGRGADPRVHLEQRLRLPGDLDPPPDHMLESSDRLEELGLQLHREVSAHNVPLRTGLRLRCWCRCPGVRVVIPWQTQGLLQGYQLPLHLLSGCHGGIV
mmetsp:Transcript_111489/g.315292  ORF Transcript_111489/g.315292 Transcript_111489/m.315292 type:complete len:225 (+) Transcript_111489:2117-2791(+)